MRLKPSFVPAIIWFIIATILLTIPGSDLPTEAWFGKVYFDKWVHIGMFALLVFLWCWALLKIFPEDDKLKVRFIKMAVLWLLYGTAMEFVQKYFIPFRSFDLYDILADGIGCLAGLLYSMKRYIKK